VWAVLLAPEPRVLALAVSAGASMLLFEPVFGRIYAARWRALVRGLRA